MWPALTIGIGTRLGDFNPAGWSVLGREGLTREMRISQFNAWNVAAEAFIAAIISEVS